MNFDKQNLKCLAANADLIKGFESMYILFLITLKCKQLLKFKQMYSSKNMYI